MGFYKKYDIIPDYIPKNTKRRSGRLINKVRFVVAHDTGNPNSTARNNVTYFKRTAAEDSASAHLFVDDKEIIECVPALTGPPEKAWHVRYNPSYDNKKFGVDANDAAIGIEYCYGTKINADEAYKRYVWVIAYICYMFGLDPIKDIATHAELDPTQRTDPHTGLAHSGRTFEQLIRDVANEYSHCTVNGGIGMPEPWKEKLVEEAKNKGLITEYHNPDDLASKWFVLAVLLNALDIVQGGKK